MAGEANLPVENYPDVIGYLSIPVHGNTTTTVYPLFYAERDMVIDSIQVMVGLADAGETATIEKKTTIASSGTALHASTCDLSSTAGTRLTPAVDTAENIVPAGYFINFVTAGALDTFYGLVQIRFRTRLR